MNIANGYHLVEFLVCYRVNCINDKSKFRKFRKEKSVYMIKSLLEFCEFINFLMKIFYCVNTIIYKHVNFDQFVYISI